MIEEVGKIEKERWINEKVGRTDREKKVWINKKVGRIKKEPG